MEISRLNLNLNLLVVFHHVLLLKRVSAVAQALGMSQPAVSSALGRLRASLGDELFLRTQAGMEPTPYALQLAEPVAAALDGLQQAFNVRAAFDPASSSRSFTIAMTDVGEMYFLPVLVEKLSAVAPSVTLQIVSVTQASLKEDMASGRIDLAMGLLPQLQAGFFQQALFHQKYICLMRQAHPLSGKSKLSLTDFTQAEHVRIVAAGTGHGRVDMALEKKKLRRQFRLTVPHYVAVGDVLKHSDLIATVPERFADRILTAFDLVKRDLPMKVDQSAIHQFWHGRLHRDPGHQWLRRFTAALFSDGRSRSSESAV
ncbi:MAG: LysR family transcriptional regulator [Rhodoferax sp.]|nr:LysR family transcriptional regulator [Rhodoferax sp.]